MTVVDLVAALLVLVGLAGIVVPVLPGTVLIWAGALVWALGAARPAAWGVLAAVTAVLAAGAVAKYLLPHRRLQASGVPRRTMVVGGLAGVVGFFVVPVVGLVVGFVAGVWAMEAQRLGTSRAWPSTRAALLAVGFSMLIELGTGLLAATGLLAGAVLL